MINHRISRFRISTRGRADYKRENGADEHDSSNDFERLCVVARALAHVRDQGRPTHTGETPGRQHQPVNGPDVSRPEEVGGKRRHRPEAPSIAQQNDKQENGKHSDRVFTYKGRPLGQVNTRSWRNALKRAGIKNFRWHDLRHVWATWHVMAGTTMAELQELGAWKLALMVKRYAHFAPEQLRAAAAKLATFSSTVPENETPEPTQAIE